MLDAFGATYDEVIAAGNSYEMRLQPLKDIHLTFHTDFEIESNSSKIYVYFFSLIAVFILILAAVLLGIISGIYSAIHLSSVRISNIITGQYGSIGGRKYLRNGLVIFQFVISIVLFISTIIIDNKLKFIQEKDIGYNRENIMIVRKIWDLDNNRDVFRNELLANPRSEKT